MFYCHLCHPDGMPIEEEDLIEHMEDVHDIHPAELQDTPVFDLAPDESEERFRPGDIL